MASTYYFWDNSNTLLEQDPAGNTLAHYVTEPDQYGNNISQRSNGLTSSYHFDGIGSTVEVTDGTGSVTDSRRNTAFGETTEQSGATPYSFKFVGRSGYYYEEETETYYVRRRNYAPEISRWTSIDPHWLTENEPNPFSYARGNPSNSTDPSGLSILPVPLPLPSPFPLPPPFGAIFGRHGFYCGLGNPPAAGWG